jgi:hypothetical protein
MNAFKEFDDMEDELSKHKPQDDGRSLKDMFRDKRETTEKHLEGKSHVESIEDRQKRLKAQRDILKAQKAEKRTQDLEEFKQKTGNQADLHKELLEMDKKVKAKQLRPSPTKDGFML